MDPKAPPRPLGQRKERQVSDSPKKPAGPSPDDLRARLGFGRPTASPVAAPRMSPKPLSERLSPSPLSQRLSPKPGTVEAVAAPAAAPMADDLLARMSSPQPASQGDDEPTPPPASQDPADLVFAAPPAGPVATPAPLQAPPAAYDPAEDEFTRPAQISPGWAPAPSSAPAMVTPPADMDPLAFLQRAPQVRAEMEARFSPQPTPAAPAPAPAPAPVVMPEPAPAPKPPEDPFASPFADAVAPAAVRPLQTLPVELLDPSMHGGDHTMAALAPVQRKHTLALIAVGAVALVLAAPLGYLVGSIGSDRAMVNRRIDDSERILGMVQKSVGKIKGILPTIKRMDPERPDFDEANKFKTFSCAIGMDEVAGDALLMGRAITGELARFTALANRFNDEVREHGRLTGSKHKVYLEQLMQANADLQSQKDVFVFFRPNAKPGGPPPKGHLVSIVGPQREEGKDILVPVRPLLSPEPRDVDINLLIGLDRGELMQSSGPNVLAMYTERVESIKKLADELDKMMDGLVKDLTRESEKARVIAF